jgi:hypothetical protein
MRLLFAVLFSVTYLTLSDVFPLSISPALSKLSFIHFPRHESKFRIIKLLDKRLSFSLRCHGSGPFRVERKRKSDSLNEFSIAFRTHRGITSSSPFSLSCSQTGKNDNGAEKVKSPITGRLINIGGPAFQKIVDLGYVLQDGQLIHRNCLPGSAEDTGGAPPDSAVDGNADTAAAAAASDAKLRAVFDRLQDGNGKVTAPCQFATSKSPQPPSPLPNPSPPLSTSHDVETPLALRVSFHPTRSLTLPFPVDGAGAEQVDLVALRAALLAIGVSMSTSRMLDLLHLADSDGRVWLDYPELKQLLLRRRPRPLLPQSPPPPPPFTPHSPSIPFTPSLPFSHPFSPIPPYPCLPILPLIPRRILPLDSLKNCDHLSPHFVTATLLKDPLPQGPARRSTRERQRIKPTGRQARVKAESTAFHISPPPERSQPAARPAPARRLTGPGPPQHPGRLHGPAL